MNRQVSSLQGDEGFPGFPGPKVMSSTSSLSQLTQFNSRIAEMKKSAVSLK